MRHEEKLKAQFSIRVRTFNQAAAWMLDPRLLEAHVRAAGWDPSPGHLRVLDLCCGTGIVGSAFVGRGWKVQGIDITPDMADEANQTFPAIAGSVEAMPFPDGLFDVAVLRQSYMLLDGPKALAEIRRVLRKNGLLVLSQSFAFDEAKDGPRYREVQEARHINMTRYYRERDLISELEENGFELVARENLRVRESVDHWLANAPELSAELRKRIRKLIAGAPDAYKTIRNVQAKGDELFEDWNWLVITATASQSR